MKLSIETNDVARRLHRRSESRFGADCPLIDPAQHGVLLSVKCLVLLLNSVWIPHGTRETRHADARTGFWLSLFRFQGATRHTPEGVGARSRDQSPNRGFIMVPVAPRGVKGVRQATWVTLATFGGQCLSVGKCLIGR